MRTVLILLAASIGTLSPCYAYAETYAVCFDGKSKIITNPFSTNGISEKDIENSFFKEFHTDGNHAICNFANSKVAANYPNSEKLDSNLYDVINWSPGPPPESEEKSDDFFEVCYLYDFGSYYYYHSALFPIYANERSKFVQNNIDMKWVSKLRSGFGFDGSIQYSCNYFRSQKDANAWERIAYNRFKSANSAAGLPFHPIKLDNIRIVD